MLLALLLLGGCEINRLKSAEGLYNDKRYAAAITELDDFVVSAKNRALATRAELLRSSSYYNLGEASAEKKNWPLAIRFFKLANSDEANLRLAEIYKDLGAVAFSSGNVEEGKNYLDAIIREVPNSPLLPEIIYRRIGYFMEVKNDSDNAWTDYMRLYDAYPNNPYEIQARTYVARFIPGKIEYARVLTGQNYYADALNVLFELAKYPVVNLEPLNKQISEVYEQQAEEYIQDQDYVEADRMFRIAMQYYPAKKNDINKRLEAITSLYVRKGDSLLAAGDFANALVHYRKTFEIIPDYQPALDAINRLFTIQENIKKAADLYAEAEKLEALGKHAEALKAYNAAFALDAKPEYRQRAAYMQNLQDANKNPAAFARRIIDEYRGGLLSQRIRSKKQELRSVYKDSEIRDSGWKLLLSTGQFKYEARYDLLTPNETYLYIWQVNLRDRSIVPLNKLSEALLK
jgi:tetratricopeptide (TPR) repeat protein